MSEVSAELTLRVIVDDAMGVASTTVFDADEIARTAALAREAARHSDPLQNFSGLYRANEPLPERAHVRRRHAPRIAPADEGARAPGDVRPRLRTRHPFRRRRTAPARRRSPSRTRTASGATAR